MSGRKQSNHKTATRGFGCNYDRLEADQYESNMEYLDRKLPRADFGSKRYAHIEINRNIAQSSYIKYSHIDTSDQVDRGLLSGDMKEMNNDNSNAKHNKQGSKTGATTYQNRHRDISDKAENTGQNRPMIRRELLFICNPWKDQIGSGRCRIRSNGDIDRNGTLIMERYRNTSGRFRISPIEEHHPTIREHNSKIKLYTHNQPPCSNKHRKKSCLHSGVAIQRIFHTLLGRKYVEYLYVDSKYIEEFGNIRITSNGGLIPSARARCHRSNLVAPMKGP